MTSPDFSKLYGAQWIKAAAVADLGNDGGFWGRLRKVDWSAALPWLWWVAPLAREACIAVGDVANCRHGLDGFAAKSRIVGCEQDVVEKRVIGGNNLIFQSIERQPRGQHFRKFAKQYCQSAIIVRRHFKTLFSRFLSSIVARRGEQ